jgi:hypothetical protein
VQCPDTVLAPMEPDARAARLKIYKHRRSAKERKALGQAKAIVKSLRTGAGQPKPTPTSVTAYSKDLQATLHSLRGEVLHKKKGDSQTVAEGLQSLSIAVAKLELAQKTADPADRLQILGDGASALAAAISEAEAAGRDWPL